MLSNTINDKSVQVGCRASSSSDDTPSSESSSDSPDEGDDSSDSAFEDEDEPQGRVVKLRGRLRVISTPHTAPHPIAPHQPSPHPTMPTTPLHPTTHSVPPHLPPTIAAVILPPFTAHRLHHPLRSTSFRPLQPSSFHRPPPTAPPTPTQLNRIPNHLSPPPLPPLPHPTPTPPQSSHRPPRGHMNVETGCPLR
jgi:hypothetical protein